MIRRFQEAWNHALFGKRDIAHQRTPDFFKLLFSRTALVPVWENNDLKKARGRLWIFLGKYVSRTALVPVRDKYFP